jgi:hypothetical protein
MWWHTVTHWRGSEGETGERSRYPALFTLPRNMLYPALLQPMRTPRLPVVDWTDAPADLNGLVRFAERRNLVSARVQSHFKRSLQLIQLFVEPSSLVLENIAGFNNLMTTNPPPNSTFLKPGQHRFVARCVLILPPRPQDALAQGQNMAEVVQNYETIIVRNTGQSASRYGKYKTFKLGVGQVYNRSSEVTVVVKAK